MRRKSRVRVYKNVTIEVRDREITDEQIDTLVARAATRNPEDMLEVTLEGAVQHRERGDNYQMADAFARRAFDHELHLARLSGEIAGYQ